MNSNNPEFSSLRVFSLILFLFITVTSVHSNPFRDSTCTVVLNTEQPALLIELMHYIKNKCGKYSVTDLEPKEAIELIKQNQNDTALMRRIDILLGHPAYQYLSQIMQATADGVNVKGNDAYRLAFISLPWRQIDMSAGYINRLADYFSLGKETAALDIVTYISQNRQIAEDSVFGIVNSFLPSECRTGSKVNIYPVIDGNRGSFAEGNDIIIELSSYNESNTALFLSTAAHEMHHVLYGNWLEHNFSDSGLSAPEKVILDWQMRMIYEGTAQQINYNMYSQDVKALYMNKELVNELFDIWISSFKKLSVSGNAETEYSELRKYLYNTFSEELLIKYYGVNYKNLLPYRPTVEYYISYNIYNTIYQTKGLSGFNYILLNPGELLNSYNDCVSTGSIVPEISADIASLWKNVLDKAKIPNK